LEGTWFILHLSTKKMVLISFKFFQMS
jgi:hypothetical protein